MSDRELVKAIIEDHARKVYAVVAKDTFECLKKELNKIEVPNKTLDYVHGYTDCIVKIEKIIDDTIYLIDKNKME